MAHEPGTTAHSVFEPLSATPAPAYDSSASTTNGSSQGPVGGTYQEAFVNSKLFHPFSHISNLELTSLDTSAAVNAIKDHPVTQQLANGPAAQSVKNETAATGNEFSNLANSRTAPPPTAATGQPLTNYHSFFYTLLSWRHPRASGITFAGIVGFIFACRYLPVLPYLFKMSFVTLGVVALAELSSKFVMGTGIASSVRPRKYYKIPKEALEASLEDLEQLINFFVIEFQRILFAENIYGTVGAFLAAFSSYYLMKIVPLWGLTLIGTCVIFLGPLIYISNQELIDGHIQNAGNIVTAQAAQVKDLTVHHTNAGLETVKNYTGDYAAKAQGIVGSARQKIPAPASSTGTTANNQSSFKANDLSTGTTHGQPGFKANDFPTAPNSDLPSATAADNALPTVNAPTQNQPIAASY